MNHSKGQTLKHASWANFVWIHKNDYRLEWRNMGKQIEPFLLTHLDGIDEQDFQQGKIQLEEHV